MRFCSYTQANHLHWVAFVSKRDRNEEIYLMNPDGSGQVNLTNNQANDWFPSWSPDGRQIMFSSHRDGHYEIYIMNLDGSNQMRLIKGQAVNSFPAWLH